MLAHLILISLGIFVIWLGFKVTEEINQITLISTGALAFVWGFAIAPSELQFAVEVLSLGSLVRWKMRG